MYSYASLNSHFNAEYLFLIYFSLGKSVALTTSDIFSFSHTMACAGLKPTPFSMKHVLSSSE